MNKIIFILVLLLFSATTSFPQTPTPTPKPADDDNDVVKISTALVQIDVTVTDRKGNVVKDLKPEDFEVFENSEKQEISNFSFVSSSSVPIEANTKPNAKDKIPVPLLSAPLKPENVRRTIALVVDDLTLSFESTYYVRRALKKFVDEQMLTGDLVAIVRTGGGIGALQQFTSDRRQLYAAIEKVRWNSRGAGGIGAFAPIEATPLERSKSLGAEVSEEQLEAEKDSIRNSNQFREDLFATGTLGAINYIVRGMKDLPGRKSIMLLSDGFQLFSETTGGFKDSTRVLESLRQLVDLANRSSVIVYTMDARGLAITGLTAQDSTSGISAEQIGERISERRDKLFDTQSGLVYLAKETGGFPIINNNDLSGGIRKILDDQSYYLIGYLPDAETFDPKTRRFNRLEIKVKRKDTTVRYRSGFFGVTDEQIQKPAKQTANQQIMTALSSPFAAGGISLHLNTLFGSDAKQGAFVRSLLHVASKDLKFTDEANNIKKAVFDVLAINFGDNGVPVDQISQTYTLTLKADQYELFLKQGFVYQFTFPIKKAGAYQMRVAVRDHASEQVGSASQFIEVPNLKKERLTLSGIVLENLSPEQFQKDQQLGTPNAKTNEKISQTDPMTDTALRNFKRGTIVRYGFEIYNAKSSSGQTPQLQVQTRIFRDGKLFFEGQPKPLDLAGQTDFHAVKSTAAINLGAGMQPGEYILQVVVTDNLANEKRKIATQLVQFEIVQ